MSAESRREFVDANVLVYALDSSAGPKKVKSESLLARLWNENSGCLSVQVLQEFFVTITAKVAQPLSADQAEDRIREYAAWRVFAPTAADVLAAIAIRKRSKIAFWDAMIVQAAAESGCAVLWTEDLNDDQLIHGVRVRNPFTSS